MFIVQAQVMMGGKVRRREKIKIAKISLKTNFFFVLHNFVGSLGLL
jgi:hypothetical protein